MPDPTRLFSPETRRLLIAACTACTVWLIVQNSVLAVFVLLHWGKP